MNWVKMAAAVQSAPHYCQHKHLFWLLVVWLVFTGQAMPPPGTVDSGSDDPPSESSDTVTSEPKTYLVMSGGEGYIDFRMGEFISPLAPLSKHRRCKMYSPLWPTWLFVWLIFFLLRWWKWRVGRFIRANSQPAVSADQGWAEPPHRLAGHNLSRLRQIKSRTVVSTPVPSGNPRMPLSNF